MNMFYPFFLPQFWYFNIFVSIKIFRRASFIDRIYFSLSTEKDVCQFKMKIKFLSNFVKNKHILLLTLFKKQKRAKRMYFFM